MNKKESGMIFSQKTKGYFFVMIAALFFSCQTVFGKFLIKMGLSGLDLSFFQFIIGAAGIFIVCIVTGKIKTVAQESKGRRRWISVMGILSAVTTACIFMSLETLNAGIASMLLFTNPVFICLFFMVTGIKKIGLWNKLALIIAMAGSMMVLNVFGASSSGMALVGIVFGISSSVLYAAYNVYYDIKMGQYSIITTASFTQYLAALTIIIIHFDIFFDFPHVTWQMIGLAAVTSLLTNLLPIFFLFKGINLIGSEKAGIVAVAELPFTLLVAFVFLGETLTFIQIAGIVLVILAVVVLQKEN
ncbi:MAG: EamA family transporter [Clostridiales bacterium]|nr:EamA family transporter [Clostridiales bacterium]